MARFLLSDHTPRNFDRDAWLARGEAELVDAELDGLESEQEDGAWRVDFAS